MPGLHKYYFLLISATTTPDTQYSHICCGLTAFLNNVSYTHVHLSWAKLDTTIITLFSFFMQCSFTEFRHLLPLPSCQALPPLLDMATFNCCHGEYVGYPTATVGFVASCNVLVWQSPWLPSKYLCDNLICCHRRVFVRDLVHSKPGRLPLKKVLLCQMHRIGYPYNVRELFHGLLIQ